MTNTFELRCRTAIVHGPSGSGKDTQLDLLAEKVSFERIGFSAIMNLLMEEGNEYALHAYEEAKIGNLSSDSDVYTLFDIWLKRLDPDKPWVFVSPVRKDTQIALFDELLTKYSRSLDLFLHFTLDEEHAIERMSLRHYCPKCKAIYHKIHQQEKASGVCDHDGTALQQREDDRPESIARRLNWYKDDIESILAEFRGRGVLLEIDAAPPIAELHEIVLKKLTKGENE